MTIEGSLNEPQPIATAPPTAPINASFHLSAAEFLTAQKQHSLYFPAAVKFRKLCRNWGVLLVVIGVICLVNYFMGRAKIVGLIFLPMGVGLLLCPLGLRRRLLKHYATRTDRDMTVNWQFNPSGVSNSTEAGSGQFEWRMISQVIQTNAGFLLYPNDRLVHWIPVHAFADVEDVDRLSRLIQSSVSNFKKEAK